MATKSQQITDLKELVSLIKHEVSEQYLKEFVPMALIFELPINPSNPFVGGCVYLNYLLCEKLKSYGYDAKLIGGGASFSFNSGQWGLIEYGQIDQTLLNGLNADGSAYNGSSFIGHCWVEIQSLGVLVDATLMHLKSVFDIDNQQRGLPTESYELDSDKIVYELSELHSHEEVFSGVIGCYYKAIDIFTAQVENLLKITIDQINICKAYKGKIILSV
ncbi:hypothetical protein HUO09_17655 [Vibrio sp. Y2-5]|uniref:hypothetical protein n=1 Tax=Vibrio sp. Y2-5 TaxID=2743977 RepID=UPI0016605E81|nr:hypothetical protein [Vibrio sp. Y2-5]MBD0788184.1 hypothetical protein [Vibrio sp. Y2-5]